MPSSALTSSAFAGRDDLLAMESIVSAAWASPARPLVHCTVGDLEWWVAGGGPDVDWSNRTSDVFQRRYKNLTYGSSVTYGF